MWGYPHLLIYIKGVKTMKMKKTEKYKLIVFFATIIILPYLFLYMEKQREIFDSVSISMIYCYMPALGVSLGLYFFEKEKLKKQNYIIMLGFTITFIEVLLTYFTILNSDVMEILVAITSLIIGLWLIAVSIFNPSSGNMYINNNISKCRKLVFPIFIIYSIATLIASGFNILSFGEFFAGIIFSVGAVSSLFGEEYGWRGYLQEILQIRFGKRIGVILLGIIWELWHFPIEIIWQKDLFVVDIFGYIVRFIFIISLAIMMGYVYMKTKNIWATAIIHAINNSMGTASLYTSDKIVWTYESIMNNSQIMRFTVVILILTIIFSTYLFTKEYSGKVEMKV